MNRTWGGLWVVGMVAALVSGCNDGKTDDPAVLITVDGGQLPTLASGQQLTLSAATAGITSPMFAWTISGTAATPVGASDQRDFTFAAVILPKKMTFSVKVVCTGKDHDGEDVSVSAAVAINARPGFHPMPDDYKVTEGTRLTVAAPGIVGNDTDGDGSDLDITLLGGPTHGSLILGDHGAFTYQPAPNYNGEDTFTYGVATPDGDVGMATVTLTVAPNNAPTVVHDSYMVAEDAMLVVAANMGVLANDSDVEGSALTVASVVMPAHGAVVMDNATGAFSYTPDANYFGTDTFTYNASDGTAVSASATVTITVTPTRDAPVGNNDSYGVPQDGSLTVAANLGLLANDIDRDLKPMTAILVTPPGHGVLTLNGDGSFGYTPDAGYAGVDSFVYEPSDDGGDGNLTTVSIKVNAPPVALPDTYAPTEDTTLIVNAAAGVLANDTDANLDTITTILVSDVQHGVLALNANGSFQYAPTANYNGPDSFTYKVNDGTVDGNTVTVTLNVAAVNDAPVAHNDAYSTAMDTPLVVAAPGLLANDTDVENDALTVSLGTGPLHGSLTLNPDGSFLYTPNAGYTGADSFTYRANDGNADSGLASVTLTIN